MPLQVLLLMTGITLLPAALMGITAFTRIIIVLGLLRQALGTGQQPSNQVLLALALFLTFMVMTPTFDAAWAAGISPYLNDQMEFRQAWTATLEPFRGFMLAQIRENDLMTFAGLSNTGPYASAADVPFGVLAASFLTSELKTAFEIAFLIYIPFVIIDLVVASVALGPRERAVVLDVGGQQLLVGVGQGGVRTLHTLEHPLPVVESTAPSPFAQVLAQHFGRKS